MYLGGDSYSAAAVYVKSNSGSWQVYYIGRDYQGSITHLIDNSGNLVQEISYDPWGRLRNPGTQLAYAPGSEPVLFLDRGYTGHEHLAVFGLINMNARLYDPALGRFLSPDPYVQAPDFSQNFNRYSYCLNNPLRFTDPSGEWAVVDDLIVAAVGGVINLAVNAFQGNIHSFSQAGAYFGVGAAGAWAGLYIGPVGAGAIIGTGNSIVTQGFGETGTWNSSNLSWQQTLFDGIIGGITAGVGSKISGVLSPYVAKFINGFGGQAVQQAIVNGATSSASGFALGTCISLSQGKSLGEALEDGGKGALQGLAIGTASGMISGIRTAYKDGENPWTGKSIQTKAETSSVYRVASDLESVDIQNNGIRVSPDGSGYQDGKLFYTTYEDALKGQALFQRYGQTSSIVEVTYPTPVINNSSLLYLDGMNAIMINSRYLNKSISISFK